MKENFSKRVQSVLKNAKEEAIRMGHSYVGSEHLLLGIIKEAHGRAYDILNSLISSIDELRMEIEEMVKSSGGTMTLGHLPLTRRAERILRTTFNEAKGFNEEVGDDIHLLLALVKETEGVASEVLTHFGIDYSVVKQRILAQQTPSSLRRSTHKPKKSATPTLDHFSRDITELARQSALDPVIGREREIARVAQILARRKKYHTILWTNWLDWYYQEQEFRSHTQTLSRQTEANRSWYALKLISRLAK